MTFTLFALPKAFAGHTGVIQRNAIRSWTLLEPRPEILLCGDDPGVADVAREMGLMHVPDIPRNEFGTPFVSELFLRAQKIASQRILCYVNSDIIFTADLPSAIARVASERREFLLAGRRWDLDWAELFEFPLGWETSLRQQARAAAQQRDEWWIDYFVFPRGQWSTMPAFAIGRPAWDNWLIRDAVRRGIPVIDATAVVTPIHQNHGYGHVRQSTGDHWRGPESDRNLELAGGSTGTFNLLDATHRIETDRIRRNVSAQPLRRALERLAERGEGRAAAVARIRHFVRGLKRLATRR